MHGLQACLFKYITVAAFHIYAQPGEDATKRGCWSFSSLVQSLLPKDTLLRTYWRPCIK